jgi:PAS domain-containing protein
MSRRLWTRETVSAAIRAEAAAGHDISYTKTFERVPALLRAGERVFGSWRTAVEAAGFDYAAIRKYRMWTRAQVIAGIQAHAAAGADLSWRHVSTVLDTALAFAALHAGRFASWDAALTAAGLDADAVRRYQRWNWDRVVAVLWSLAARGVALNQATLQVDAPDVLAAFYRRGGNLGTLRAQYAAAALSRPVNEQFTLLCAAVDHDTHAVLITDAAGRITFINRQYATLRGVTPAQMIDQPLRAHHWQKLAPAEYTALWDAVLTDGEWYGEYPDQRSGESNREAASISVIASEPAASKHVVVVFDEITAGRRQELPRFEGASRRFDARKSLGQPA